MIPKQKETDDVWRLFDLSGQTAIVTGGAGQLGSQTCDALAEAGARIAVVSRDLQKCQRKADELIAAQFDAQAFPVDVTKTQSVREMVGRVAEAFGRIDILINNAYSGALRPFEEMSVHEFEAATTGALTSTFLCSQAVAPVMKSQGKGVIVNIASMYGLVAPDERIYGESGLNSPCNYGPAKAGVIQFTRWLAVHFAPDGIRSNCISPGGFYNERFSNRPGYEETFVPRYCARTPMNRMGGYGDLKGAALFLASDASRYVTGHNLVVDGGWTAW